MKILAIETEVAGISHDQFTPELLQAEAEQVWEFYQSGIFRELYFRDDCSRAVIVLECPDLAAAQAKLNRLPLVKARLITFDLIALVPYPGFSRLFSHQA